MVESAVSLRYIPPNLMMAFGWVGPAVFGHVVGWALIKTEKHRRETSSIQDQTEF